MRTLIEDPSLLAYQPEERKFIPTDLNQLVDDVRNELRETIEQKMPCSNTATCLAYRLYLSSSIN